MEKDALLQYQKNHYYASHLPDAGNTIKTFELETGSSPSKGYGVDITKKLSVRESAKPLPELKAKINTPHKQLTLKY